MSGSPKPCAKLTDGMTPLQSYGALFKDFMPSAKLAAYAAPSAEHGLSREVLARQYGINRTA